MLAYYGGFRHNMGNLSKSCEGFKQVMWRTQAHCGGWKHNVGNLRMCGNANMLLGCILWDIGMCGGVYIVVGDAVLLCRFWKVLGDACIV